MKFEFNWPSGLEKMFEIADGRTPEWLVYNKLPNEPSAQVS